MIDSRTLVRRASERVILDADGRRQGVRMIESRTLTRRAAELMALENSDTVVGKMLVSDLLMSEFGVTRARANTAVATAARLARYQRMADDDDESQMTKILRVKMTYRQFELLRMMADVENTDMSKIVRRKVFA